MTKKGLLRNLGISLSLAALLFVRIFRNLLYPSDNSYYEYSTPTLEFLALFLCVGIVTVLFFLLAFAIEKVKNSAIRSGLILVYLAFGLACYMALNSEVMNYLVPERDHSINYELPLLVLAISLVLSLRERLSLSNLVSSFQSVTLVFLVFGFLLFIRSAVLLSGLVGPELGPESINKPGAPANQRRVVWLIFDEFDYATTSTRPKEIEMPAFDRLMNESFVAESAYPPNFWTRQSIPSLLSGELVSTIEPKSPTRLDLVFQNSENGRSLSDAGNIFERVKALGGTSGVVGWVHPYPRVFQDSIDRGYWQGAQVVRCEGVSHCMAELSAVAAQSLPIPNPFESFRKYNDRGHIVQERFLEGQLKRAPFIQEKAVQMSADSSLSFVFVHFSIPHARFLDRKLQMASRGYLESLGAVDETLSIMRETMMANGVWDSTSVIVSSDHWWRFKTNEYLSYLPEKTRVDVMQDRRVPFVIKLAGQSEKITYPTQFNTVATHAIVLGLLSGELKNGSDVAAKIDDLRSRRPLEMNHIPDREQMTPDVFERNAGNFRFDPVEANH